MWSQQLATTRIQLDNRDDHPSKTKKGEYAFIIGIPYL